MTRIAILNHPAAPTAVEWSPDALEVLTQLGFDTVQLNIAWGARPADEPLNLEDVLPDVRGEGVTPQSLPPTADPERRPERLRLMRERLRLAKDAGLRTIFHFGAPFNQHAAHGGEPPNCLSDPGVALRYERYLDALADVLPVDDLLLYTYDQDAWLCSEFGVCSRCAGVPLHERLVPFLERLAARWRRNRPEGRVWWEPWELSAGQTLRIVSTVRPEGLGLALHNNFAEVMVSRAVDQHVRNCAKRAAARGIPVVIEGFLGAASEEVEPFLSLQSPLTTYAQVRAMLDVDGATGVKEYYGLDTSWADPNLRAASIAMTEPAIAGETLVRRLSEGYGSEPARRMVEEIWRLTSEAMDLYPWDASWFAREVGRSDPEHSLNGAFVRGFCADTPSWRSSRGSTFMAITDAEPHPWLLEDLQLRWEACAERQEAALRLATDLDLDELGEHRTRFAAFLGELDEFSRRVRAFAFHCRETVLSDQLRRAIAEGRTDVVERVRLELLAVLRSDRANMRTAVLDPLIETLTSDPTAFATRWFLPTEASPDPRRHVTDPVFPAPKGYFSVTSR